MTADLETRLRAYRPALDAAIEARVDGDAAYVPPCPDAHAGRRRWLVGAALVSAVAAVVMVVAVVGPPADRSTTVTPASAPDQARVVLDAQGWTMSRVDEYDAGGEQTFVNGASQAELHWSRGGSAELQQLVSDRTQKSGAPGATTAAGQPATLLTLNRDATTGEYLALWAGGGAVYEFRGKAATPEAFGDLAGHLRVVDAATWRAALPTSAVAPDSRAGEVNAMLEGIPLPPGFDVSSLRTSDQTKERYQLGAQVVGAVACGWIQEWVAARTVGDSGRVAAATAALATSHGWPVLQQMNAEGDYPEVLWQYADAIAGDGTVMGGKRLTVEQSFSDALGC